MYYKSPTYNIDTKEWGYTEFETRKDVVTYIDKQFKYPGRYDLKYTDGYWNLQGKIWERTGSYPVYVNKSIDFRKHWDDEKERCQFDGFLIYKSDADGIEFAVPCLFYWYLNYCPIMDKVKQKITPAEIYDGDYHYFLYILRCILHRKYGVVLKKRQAGYTLKNMAILLNAIWFGNAAVSKIFASDKTKVEDSWVHMERYRDHINQFCGWKRGFDPSKKLDWQIRRKQVDGSYKGNLSIAKGFTTQQSPTNGVGGNATVIFGEEAGINPTLNITHEYITSNVSLGGLTTGLIIYSGAVGELDKAEPLKAFITHPEVYGFLACDNEVEEDAEFGAKTGFFAPEWWNFVSVNEEDGSVRNCYDKWGNTDKELAMMEIKKQRLDASVRSSSSYRYYCSQRPLSIKEAFDYRKDAYFNQEIVLNRITRFGIKPDKLHDVVLYEDETGQVKSRLRSDINNEPRPITKFPLGDKDSKEGCVVIKEYPPQDRKAEMFEYFGGVDDIATDVTKTSESLFSVYIFKNIKEIKYLDGEVVKTRIEGNEPVAWYTGRRGDMKETHRIAELLIRFYNAKTAVENNVQNFINYMQARGLHHLLATKAELPFVGELQPSSDVHRPYGVYIASNGTIKNYLLASVKEYVTEILDVQRRQDTGEIMRTVYGIDRISDLGLLTEIQKFHSTLNTDRLIAFMLAQSMAKSYQIGGIIQREDQVKEKKDEIAPAKPRSFFKSTTPELEHSGLRRTFFKHMQ